MSAELRTCCLWIDLLNCISKLLPVLASEMLSEETFVKSFPLTGAFDFEYCFAMTSNGNGGGGGLELSKQMSVKQNQID